MNGAYFSGGGLFSTAEDYLQFGLMLMNGVAVMVTQVANLTDRGEVRNAFEDAVMQALVGCGSIVATN